MTEENKIKVKGINERIDRLKELIKNCYNNSERARLDNEIKKCREEIAAIKDLDKKPMKTVTRIDDPTVLERKNRNNVINVGTGSIKKLGGGNFSISL